MAKQTISKTERLKSRKAIDRLFSQRQFNKAFPLKLQYEITANTSHQFAVVVPKRLHKHAVDRNKIKRQMREAFRLQKHELQQKVHFNMMFIYTSPQQLQFEQILKAVKRHISFLNQLKS
ncbi:ribonuclease P protein component [Psychroflexus sp. ALD_RP9]|uniref:ribonuclease P protein component n=1 Tax=Psychroflexus sp. ALD_RP9 TaxID=2777186 RepID=UPI001A8F4C6D|nr:ribonuclease P protein component [Psychroflexus sp. ALD_RP9]QSS98144.1 ribonuclease P protein component [Psychroflexus sp. ALD_RP9]